MRRRAAVLGLLAVGSDAHAQAASEPPPSLIQSMGQPPRWQPYAAGLGIGDRRSDRVSATALVGVHRPLMNPVTGVAGAAAEVYGTRGGVFDGLGVRLLGRSPIFGLAVGADWNVSQRRVDFILSLQTAVRRGGVFGGGTMVRADWLPTRGGALGLGVNVPVMQPFVGRTRPRRTDVRLPAARVSDVGPLSPVSSLIDSALQIVAGAAGLITVYSSIYSDADVHRVQSAATHAAATRSYHGALTRGFTIAAGNSVLGRLLAARARAGALEDVVLPYDALFGQVKRDDIRGLTRRAHDSFVRWVRDSSGVGAAARPTVEATHALWLGVLEDVHRQLRARSKDSREIWLPFQLALVPEDFDEQVEVDSLIARAVGRPFTDQNALTMLRSSDLPLEIARSVYAARDYHVLWMHDFAGRREKTGAVDNISYEMVADAYLPALTEAVKRYDATGRLPTYIVLLDQFFYEPRAGRLWMTILEDPLSAAMRLPGDNADREAHLRRRQAELRAAVRASARLQRDAARSGGDRWLRRVVKVHVSVTHPSDFSFRSHHIIPGIALTPDNVMRDHRKIALYDLTEADPYRGAMFLMGVGIGEHYASATWEDRGYRIRGPAAIEARTAARRLLRQQGFHEADIPAPLREAASAPAAERRAALGDYVGRALQVHNEVGFGPKQASVVRALLYELAQPGSVVVVPDPLWLSAKWAAMLAGAAARGARVHVIAPALANAPSPQAPLMALSHGVMLRLIQLRDRLDGRIRGAGGELRVGLFGANAQVDDAAGRRREVREGLQRAPWIRELIPFDAQTLAVLDRAETRAATDGAAATDRARDEEPRPPQLHQKTQLIARPGAIAALVRQPGWDDVLGRAMEAQSRQTARFAEQLGFTTPALETNAMQSTDVLLRGYEQAIPEAERKNVSFYFTLGTQNQDPRGMMLDGEATLVVSGVYASAGLVDLYYLMARTTWITTQAELERLLPPPSELMRRLARLIRPAL